MCVAVCQSFCFPAESRRLRLGYNIGEEDCVEALLNHVSDDCCNSVVDHEGNTLLHVAIAESLERQQGWAVLCLREKWALSRVDKIVARLIKRQAALTRNKDGKLPIDLAMEGDKEPRSSTTLSQVAPRILEYRNTSSMLYPFQQMVCSSGPSGPDANLSSCFSFLCMTPHLVSTEENIAFLLSSKFIEASRFRLEHWTPQSDGHAARQTLELQDQINARKRTQDALHLMEAARRCSTRESA